MESIRFDVVLHNDETVEQAIANLTLGLDVEGRPTGCYEAGGWPEIEFTGSIDALAEVRRRYDGTSDV